MIEQTGLSTYWRMSPARRTIQRLLLVVLVLGCEGALAIQDEAPHDFNGHVFRAAIETLHDESRVPGLAVAVLQGGELLHADGYGVAGPDGRAVTTQTAFSIGSITKSFVAIVILQLASEGRLDLDDPVVRHIPGFRTANKAQSDHITIDHLVTHRSGLTTLEGNSASGVELDPADLSSVISNLQGAELHAEPGAQFQYSNANYAVLSFLIEVVDGRSFEAALAARIFEPLGMASSFVQRPPTDAIPLATGYRLWFGIPVAWQAKESGVSDRQMIGAGGIWASIEDLARYVEAVRTRDSRIVPDGADRLFEIRPVMGPWGYAYGWVSESSGDAPFFEHSGFTPGFFTLATIVPADEQVVVVLTNMSGLAHGDLPRAITHAALGREPVPAAAPLSARLAIWSAVMAPLGLILLLIKAGRRLLSRGEPMRRRVRVLNVVAAALLVVGVITLHKLFPVLLGVSFPTGLAFFPDLTWTAIAAMVIALLLAAVCLALAVRGD